MFIFGQKQPPSSIIEEVVLLRVLQIHGLAAAVDAVLDAQHCVEPHVENGHERLLVLVAKEVRRHHPDVLLREHCLHYFLLVSFDELFGTWFFALVRCAGDVPGHVLDDLAEQVGEFLLIFEEEGGQTHEDAEVLLVTQHQLADLPLLLLGEVAISFDEVDALLLLGCAEGLVAGGQGGLCQFDAGVFKDAFHALQVGVEHVLLKAGPAAEEQVALLHPLFFFAQHQVGPPASFLLQLHLQLLLQFCVREGGWRKALGGACEELVIVGM